MNRTHALSEWARELATQGQIPVDAKAYQDAGRDLYTPLIATGPLDAAVGFFGRDPGRDEVRWLEPLIGAGGRLVRTGIYQATHGHPPADFDALRDASKLAFYSNTVPYKPIGNKPWPREVVAMFRPVIAEALLLWQGEHLITLGNDAFLWFGDEAEAFWAREDRYERSLTVTWPRRLTLHPLPHPSPANAIWHQKFPSMLAHRLDALGVRPGTSGPVSMGA